MIPFSIAVLIIALIQASLSALNLQQCEANGGHVAELYALPEDGVLRYRCDCPFNKFGRWCQYSCPSGDIHLCHEEKRHDEICVQAMLFESGTFCNWFPYIPEQSNDCFYGFDALYEFAGTNITAYKSLRVELRDSWTSETDPEFSSFELSSTCFDFAIEQRADLTYSFQLGRCALTEWDWLGSILSGDLHDLALVPGVNDYNAMTVFDFTDFPPTSFLNITVCKYGCAEGFYGERCDLKCDPLCTRNGGECNFVYNLDGQAPNAGDAQSVSRIDCICPAEKAGRLCQYDCLSGESIEECLNYVVAASSDTECKKMSIWSDGDYEEFPVSYNDYLNGFGSVGEGVMWTVDVGFVGLYELHQFSPYETVRPSSLKFTVTDMDENVFQKTCFDPVFMGEEDEFKLFLAPADHCFGDAEISSDDILFHTQVGFSVIDHDVDLDDEINMCMFHGPGWHRREPRMNYLGNLEIASFGGKVAQVDVEICRYQCPPGTYGEHCNVKCPVDYCGDGGVCEILGNENDGYQGVRCVCHPNRFGVNCQFECTLDDLGKCVRNVDASKECTPLLIRTKDSQVDFDLGFRDYKDGFGDVLDGYWAGLSTVSEFMARKENNNDFSTISFSVESGDNKYQKSCVDFRLGSVDDGYTFDVGQCYGDSTTFLDADIEYMKQSKFTTLDSVNGRYGGDCVAQFGGGWWFFGQECGRFLPTTTNPNSLLVDSVTDNADSVRVDVCNYYIKESCENVVVHQTDRVDFNKTMRDYSQGFGDCSSGDDCFGGLDYLSHITNQLVDLDLVLDVGYQGQSYEAKCSFRVQDKFSSYTLNIKGDSCVADPELSISNILYHNNLMFSAKDEDITSCAAEHGCGWWFDDCYEMLPTGEYSQNMYFESLNYGTGDSVNKFNVQACGSIKEKSDEKLVDELRGVSCRKVLLRTSPEEEETEDGEVIVNEVLFDRSYSDYLKGFGGDCAKGESCWIGLTELERLTKTPKKLIIDVSHRGTIHSLGCLDFQVSKNEHDEYVFDVGSCYGSSALDRNMLKRQAGEPFTTMDHPVGVVHCPATTRAGWFYDDSCGGINPTGVYGSQIDTGTGIFYESLTTLSESASRFEISICGSTFEEDVKKMGCTEFLTRGSNGGVSFDRSYSEYVSGFGDPTEEEGWLGLEALHQMSEIPQFLDIKYTYDGEQFGVHCGLFFVESAEEEYAVHFEFCQGDDDNDEVIPFLEYHNGAPFSTPDHPVEYEVCDQNCAVETNTGWWYRPPTSTPYGCHRFHPTGVHGIVDFQKGINFGSLMVGLDSVQMSMCRIRDETKNEQDFVFEKARACSRDCDRFLAKTFNLREEEQLFMYNQEFYQNSGGEVYLDVFTGPQKSLSLNPNTKSFFSQVLKWPVVFTQEDMKYLDLDGSGLPAGMMYIRDTCMYIPECGWGADTETYRVGSAYIPRGFKVTFFEKKFELVTADDNMYVMGGGTYDMNINLDTRSWLLEMEFFADDQKYPVLFRDVVFATDPVELRYSCSSDCDVLHYRSIFVPSGYVVELFSNEHYNVLPGGGTSGIKRKFVGPVALDFIDGYFGSHAIQSYKSGLTTIERIEVNIIRFKFDEVAEDDSAESNVNELVVSNPTHGIREVKFTDSYSTYEERNWELSQFVETGATASTEVVLTSSSSFTFSTKLSSYAMVYAYARAEASAVVAKVTAEAGVRAGVGFEMTTDLVKQKSEVTTTKAAVTFETKIGSETGGVYSTENVKTFTYQCVALPFTKTTCQAKQVKGVYSIPYDAEKRIIYTNGKIVTTQFEGVVENAIATHVYFVVQEQQLDGFCKFGFTEFKGACKRAVKLAEEEDVSDLAASMKSPLDINYLPMDLVEGDQLCYQQEGAVPTSVHSAMELFHATRECNYFTPVLIGAKYSAAEDKIVNIDGTPFDYDRFPTSESFSMPTVDSYIVVDDMGYYKFVANDAPKEALCVVCSKDLNVQLMT